MEGGSSSIDKLRVLDVKPLRSLVPVFSGPPVCTPPFGPFPPGFSPFFPFSPTEQNQAANAANQTPEPAMPAPIRSFRSPNGDTESSSKTRGKKRNATNVSSSARKGSSNFVVGISSSKRDDGDREIVIYVLMEFDGIRRRLSQLEDAKEAPTGIIRRADLKAGNIVMSKGLRTNMRKRIGSVPGVEIGDIFFFRMEMCVVGLHSQSMGGIDYLVLKDGVEDDTVALSIVSSGSYEDVAEDSDVLIYSGQGGTVNFKQALDQKLVKGNLALERSIRRGNEVRVIRGIKDAKLPTKVYIYDGLYTIQESWTEKSKSGCNTFKYKLVRMSGQPGAFTVWKSVQKWRQGLSSRPGLILSDLTSGAESIPVSLVNDVDGEKGPAYFTYVPTLTYSKSVNFSHPSFSCNCQSSCLPGDLDCSCIRKNDGDFPYTAHGVLVTRKPMLHECGPTCTCFPNCKNRVSQTGLKVNLEVFKTKDKGWGLRSWDPIRAGTFICEYAGEVIDKVMAKRGGQEDETDTYIFDTTRIYGSFKWNYEPGLLEEDKSSDSTEEYNIPYPFIITAKNIGNVSRFMNHSCSPNVFWQPVLYEQNEQSFLHIAFFAMRHIPPMTELMYDYGIVRADGAEGNSTPRGRDKCLCGSSKCGGYFG